jgi:hypothetical protein
VRRTARRDGPEKARLTWLQSRRALPAASAERLANLAVENACQAPLALFDVDGSIADDDAAMRRDLRAMRAPCEPPVLEADSMHDLEQEHPHLEARIRFVESTPSR